MALPREIVKCIIDAEGDCSKAQFSYRLGEHYVCPNCPIAGYCDTSSKFVKTSLGMAARYRGKVQVARDYLEKEN